MSVLRKHFWKLYTYAQSTLLGDRGWGYLRLLIVSGITLVFMVLSVQLIQQPNQEPNLVLPPNHRFWVAPVAALVAAFLVATNYIRDIYELPNFQVSFRYFFATVFGFFYPKLRIAHGKKDLGEDEVNTLEVIGGPGSVNIEPGNVVLFERLRGPSGVYGGGKHFINRREWIKEIASLDDQIIPVEAVPATTKDGIEVIVRDIKFCFRLRTGRRPGDYAQRTAADPYPYSVQAVRNMAYSRRVNPSGLNPWHAAVRGTLEGVISDYIREHKFDDLMTPTFRAEDAREAIGKLMRSKGVREKLRSQGAELLWFDVGQFQPAEEVVTNQYFENWEASWKGEASVTRAYGEAERLVLQEQGRAEAQADMLVSIMQALEQANPDGTLPQNLLSVVLLRTAQILDAMTEANPDNPVKELRSPS